MYSSILAFALFVHLPLIQSEHQKFEVTKITEGVYVAIRANTLRHPVEGNVTIIVNDKDVVVVDSSRTAASARIIIAEIRKITDKPVRYLINTHWHGDHHHGNSVYRQEYPGVEIIAHRYTREDIVTRGVPSLEGQIRSFGNRERLTQILESGVDLQGKPLQQSTKHRIRQMLEVPDSHLAELKDVKITEPTLSYEQSFTIHRGQREIRSFCNGPGNTRGDSVIYLPQEKIVITGDLLVSTIPFMSESRPRGWLARLKEIAALNAETIIPGHGTLQLDRKYLDLHIALLESLISQVDSCIRDGLSLEETRKRVNLDRFREQYSNGDKFLMDEFDYRVTEPAIEDAYREAKGK